jgi:hypothetical protein
MEDSFPHLQDTANGPYSEPHEYFTPHNQFIGTFQCTVSEKGAKKIRIRKNIYFADEKISSISSKFCLGWYQWSRTCQPLELVVVMLLFALGFPRCFFPSGISTKNLYALLSLLCMLYGPTISSPFISAL